jgi:hypothetical protein
VSSIRIDFPDANDVQRLTAMQGSDQGFFVLALFSFMETYMKKELGYLSDDNKDVDHFRTLTESYTEYLKSKNNNFLPTRDYHFLKNLPNQKNITNEVRHKFAELRTEETAEAVYTFKRFLEVSKVPFNEQFQSFEKYFEIWKRREVTKGMLVELDEAQKQLALLKKQNAEIIQKNQEYEKAQTDLAEYQAKIAYLDSQLDAAAAGNRKNDKKYDELRKENFNTKEQLRIKEKELQQKLSEFDKVKTYVENIQRMSLYTRTRNDYEKAIIRLTPDQQRVVNLIHEDHDFLIKGAAGTGKSFVLLKGLEKLLTPSPLFPDSHPSVVLLTYTNSLKKYNAYIAQLMNPNLDTSKIVTVDSFLYTLYYKVLPGKTINVGRDDSFVTYFPNDTASGITADQALREAINCIWPNMLTEEEYCSSYERRGMKYPLDAKKRRTMWQLVQQGGERILAANSEMPNNYVTYLAATAIRDKKYSIEQLYDYIFIDEAQDLNTAQLYLLKASAKHGVILAGDSDQSIFQPAFSWKRSGIDVSGYSYTLQTDFRNTVQIAETAEKYRATIAGMNKESVPHAFRLGPPVELTTASDVDSLFNLIADKTELCIKQLSYAPENICIIVTKNDQIEKLSYLLKEKYGINSISIHDKDFEFSKVDFVRISTHQSSKGLDFPVVLLLEDHRVRVFESNFDEQQSMKMQRSLIYVAMTRAMDMLNVFTLAEPTSPVIKDLKTILEQE